MSNIFLESSSGMSSFFSILRDCSFSIPMIWLMDATRSSSVVAVNAYCGAERGGKRSECLEKEERSVGEARNLELEEEKHALEDGNEDLVGRMKGFRTGRVIVEEIGVQLVYLVC